MWFPPDIDFPILVSYTAVLGCMLCSIQCSQYMVFDTIGLGFDLLKQHKALFLFLFHKFTLQTWVLSAYYSTMFLLAACGYTLNNLNH